MGILDRLREQFDPGVAADAMALWLPNLLVAAITLAAFWLLHRFVRRGVLFVMERGSVDKTAVSFVQNLIQYALFTVASITALGQVGVDVSSLLASLGVAGLTIGFAARDALSNVISGLFIFWDRPFVIGDLVEIGKDYGEVKEITMRSTRVVTPDGRMLAIPNSTVVNGTVASYTNFPHLRIEVDVTVGVNEDLGRVRAIFLELIKGESSFLPTPAPAMVVTALNDYNVAVQFRVWLEDEKKHIATRFALRERIFVALTEAGIDMPYETIALTPLTIRKLTGDTPA